MASVDEYAWKFCRACKAEGRRKPTGTDTCTCKPVAWRTRWRDPAGASRSEVFDRKGDADAKKAKMETAKRDGTYIDAKRGRQQFTAYADEWAETRDWKANTRAKSWPQCRKRLAWTFGTATLVEIDKMALETGRGKLAKRYSRGVVEGTMARAKAIMRHAYANGAIGRDPTVDITSAPKLRAGDRRGVTPDEVPTRAEARLIVASTAVERRAGNALGLAGLRIGEMLGAHAEDITVPDDESPWTLRVHRQTDGYDLTSVKNERERTIILPDLVAAELRRHLQDHPTGLLFPGTAAPCPCGCGKRLAYTADWYRLAWWPALVAAGFKSAEGGKATFVFHSLRHFCASTLLAEGAPLPAVAGYLGDVVQTVSRTYAHWLRDDQNVPAQVLNQVFDDTTGDTTDQAPQDSDESDVSARCHDDMDEAA